MSKLPLFERTVDKIVTDNSKVIAALQAENAKLQQENGELKTYVDSLRQDYEVYRDQRDLEQQAKGLDKLSESMLFRGHLENTVDRDEVKDFAKELRSQAKGEL